MRRIFRLAVLLLLSLNAWATCPDSVVDPVDGKLTSVRCAPETSAAAVAQQPGIIPRTLEVLGFTNRVSFSEISKPCKAMVQAAFPKCAMTRRPYDPVCEPQVGEDGVIFQGLSNSCRAELVKKLGAPTDFYDLYSCGREPVTSKQSILGVGANGTVMALVANCDVLRAQIDSAANGSVNKVTIDKQSTQMTAWCRDRDTRGESDRGALFRVCANEKLSDQERSQFAATMVRLQAGIDKKIAEDPPVTERSGAQN